MVKRIVVLALGALALAGGWRVWTRQVVQCCLPSSSSSDDFDRLLGERRAVEGQVCGPRVRIEGIAAVSFREVSYLEGDGDRPFSIRLESIDWPEQVVGQRVSVEGVLSRQWHASVGTLRTSPRPWNAEVKNHLTGTGTGFGYCLRDCVFEIADKKVPQADERDGHD